MAVQRSADGVLISKQGNDVCSSSRGGIKEMRTGIGFSILGWEIPEALGVELG